MFLSSRRADRSHQIIQPLRLRDDVLILEIRAAMGGADAELFAAELARAYLGFAERRGWAREALEWRNAGDGIRLAVLRLAGPGVAGLSSEAGTHRVQRQPVTDRAGRRHTSAVTVSTLPIPADLSTILDLREVSLETFRSSGAGGQNIQKTETAVRATHRPSGLTAAVQDERSQSQNRQRALELLGARVAARAQGQADGERSDLRRSMVGSGHIAERIRTYAYREGLVTDHRSGAVMPLDRFLAGAFEPLIG